jgi:hypothetical protein
MPTGFDDDLAWIRRDSRLGPTIRSAIPSGFDVYAVLDLVDERADAALLAVLAPNGTDLLVAGWIVKSEPASGDEHLLYANWPYRLRRATAAELRAAVAGEDGFPDLLFPRDHAWIVSTLWDDAWRSIGADAPTALELERALPAMDRVDPDADLATTGRRVL